MAVSERDRDYMRRLGEFQAQGHADALAVHLALPLAEVSPVTSAADGGVATATPEDLILLELVAHRPKDLADLAGLLALDGLDWSYVEDRARDWDVTDRLARLRASP